MGWLSNWLNPNSGDKFLTEGVNHTSDGAIWFSQGKKERVTTGIYAGVEYRDGKVWLPPCKKEFSHLSYPEELKARGLS